MRLTSLFIIVSTLLSIVFALPAAVPKDQSLSKCSTDVGRDDIPSLSCPFEVGSDGLLDRGISDLFRRVRSKGRARGPNGLPPKITFADTARKNLDDAGLHGKERKKAKNYHKNLVKSYMKKFPNAHTAEIAHIAHYGGSNKNEPLHATVALRRKPLRGNTVSKKDNIQSTFKNQAGVTKTGGLHHVYPKAGQHHWKQY